MVTETSTNRQSASYDYLHVVNINLDHILYRFRDIATKISEIAVLSSPVSFGGAENAGPENAGPNVRGSNAVPAETPRNAANLFS